MTTVAPGAGIMGGDSFWEAKAVLLLTMVSSRLGH